MLGAGYKKELFGSESDHFHPLLVQPSSMSRRSGMEQANKRARYHAMLNKQKGRGSGTGFGPTMLADQPPRVTRLLPTGAGKLCPFFKNRGMAEDGDREWSEEEKNSTRPKSDGKPVIERYTKPKLTSHSQESRFVSCGWRTPSVSQRTKRWWMRPTWPGETSTSSRLATRSLAVRGGPFSGARAGHPHLRCVSRMSKAKGYGACRSGPSKSRSRVWSSRSTIFRGLRCKFTLRVR